MPSKPLLIQTTSQVSLSAAGLFIPLAVRDMGGLGIQVGLVVAGYNLAFLFSNMMAGRAADIYARRWIVRFGLLCSVLAFLFQYMVLAWNSGLFVFAVSRFIGGAAAGIFPNALLAFVYERTGKVGGFASRGSLGWGLGMLVAGVLSSIQTVFLASTILLAAAFLIAMFLEPLGEKGLKIPFFPRDIIRRNKGVYGTLLIRHTGASMVWVTFPLFMEDLGATHFWIGIIYSINMATQVVWMSILDRFNTHNMIPVGLVFTALSFLIFPMARVWWHLLPMQILLGTSWATLYIGCLRTVMDRNQEKATSAGLVASTISLSGLLGPLLGGSLVGLISYGGVMYMASIAALFALVWHILNQAKTLC